MLNVSNATISIDEPLNANIHQLNVVRYAKSSSHLFIAHQARGAAMTNANNTSVINSFESSATIWVTEAPTTLRTPISFVLRVVVYITSPKSPKQLMNPARAVHQLSRLAVSCSFL